MRALEPTVAGFVERNGARVGYEVFGEGETTLLLMPTFSVVHSRIWKMQVPALARRYRVITFDGVGNGRSDRPLDVERYSGAEHVEDALAVLEALGADTVVAFAASGGTYATLRLAADHPERVDGILLVGAASPFGATPDDIFVSLFGGDLDTFLDRFMRAAFSEPHSTKPIDDAVGWGQETTAEVLQVAITAVMQDMGDFEAVCSKVRCPVLVLQGSDDQITPEAHGRGIVDAIGDNTSLVIVDGGGHRSDVRDPVRFTLLAREFIETIQPRPIPKERRWGHAPRRRRRALFVSSPIGLGHARRDIAIAHELRALHPDLQIDWLAQPPVVSALTAAGEAVHPASALLAREVAHFEAETAGHDLHCFQAWRGLDESLAANFMVFHDLLDEQTYDLVVGDEAWEIDHFLHENPELKRFAYAWLTDFVGWLPMTAGDVELTADYNAQMVEQIRRYPRVRDHALFVGNPDDIVPDDFGAGLPGIREWTEEHYDFSGYISGIEPVTPEQRAHLRHELGFADDETICIVTAGGSGVGRKLLGDIIDAYAHAAKAVPNLRMVVVAGPRIDPASFDVPAATVEVHGYIPDLHRYLAACDVAAVQGGLTTAMELTMNQRPFIYFPLQRHFEQQRHVPHRLDRYGAGRRMDLDDVGPDGIADALVAELARSVEYRPVETGGAARAASLLASLI